MTATATPASLPSIDQKGYAHPEMLVSTEWLAAHLNDPSIRIIESDEDVLLYDMGHIPNAQKVDWHTDLNDSIVRDYVSSEQFQELLRSKGIDENTTVVFYGDKNNWWMQRNDHAAGIHKTGQRLARMASDAFTLDFDIILA